MSIWSRLFRKRPNETVSLSEPVSDDMTLGDFLKALEKRLREVEQGFWRIDKRLQRAGILPAGDNGDDKKVPALQAGFVPGAAGQEQESFHGRVPQEGDDLAGVAGLDQLFKGGAE